MTRNHHPWLLLCSLLLLFSSSFLLLVNGEEAVATTATTVVSGSIVSCSGWRLNRYPELKAFLKGGEAESYENVDITYISGKDAVLTITRRDASTGDLVGEVEQVQLHQYPTKQSLHELFESKGFTKKSDNEIDFIKTQRMLQQQGEADDRTRIMKEKHMRQVSDIQQKIKVIEQTIQKKKSAGEPIDKEEEELKAKTKLMERYQKRYEEMVSQLGNANHRKKNSMEFNMGGAGAGANDMRERLMQEKQMNRVADMEQKINLLKEKVKLREQNGEDVQREKEEIEKKEKHVQQLKRRYKDMIHQLDMAEGKKKKKDEL